MTGEQVVAAVIDALRELDVPFMIVGSMATNFYGVPRSTRDADFVVQLAPATLSALRDRLAPELRIAPQISFEGVTGTTRHRVEAAGTVFTAELFELSDDPHDVSRFARRHRVRVFDRDAFVATAEDTIVTKLRWARQPHRAKDLDDARNVVAVQAGNLDWDYIQNWCERHGTADLMDVIRRSVSS